MDVAIGHEVAHHAGQRGGGAARGAEQDVAAILGLCQQSLYAVGLLGRDIQHFHIHEHVRVDVVYGSLAPRLKLWVDLLGGILFLLPPVMVIGWMSWPLFYESLVSGETSNNAGGLIRWPVKLFLPLGFGLLALQGVSEIIKRAAALAGHQGEITDYGKPVQ